MQAFLIVRQNSCLHRGLKRKSAREVKSANVFVDFTLATWLRVEFARGYLANDGANSERRKFDGSLASFVCVTFCTLTMSCGRAHLEDTFDVTLHKEHETPARLSFLREANIK
jgi:hypothetical protein